MAFVCAGTDKLKYKAGDMRRMMERGGGKEGRRGGGEEGTGQNCLPLSRFSLAASSISPAFSLWSDSLLSPSL